MKIGIMSMQRIENYGSFLQAFSLRQMLEELGHEVVFVDYKISPCLVREPVAPQPHHSIPYRAIRKIYHLCRETIRTWNGQKKAEQALENSRLRNKYSEYLTQLGITQERSENTPVDVLVIGSDEVFNCLQTNPAVGYSKQLFGEGVYAKKVITYAACAGFTTVEGLEKFGICHEVSQMLKNNFSAISVRDQNTYDLVHALTGWEPQMHCDPVLIADFSSQIAEKKDISKYVVVYSYEERMSGRTLERDTIQSFAHARGLKTVSIGNFQAWTDLHIEASPFELLGYIKNADYVVTDTFHGTVFSIVMEKQFATIVRESNTQKISSLLKQFALEGRHLNNLENLEKILEIPTDYTHVRAVRQKYRNDSMQYLKRSIG